MKKHGAILLTIITGLLTPVFPQADSLTGANDPSKRVFEIPVYPGTVPFNTNPRFERWHAPFGTSLRVYRTGDGGALDKEKVISFYKNELTSKGWRDHIFKRQGDEAYLGLQINLTVDLPNTSRVLVSGTFYLWVAPRDGMYTILVDQWRNPSRNPEVHGSQWPSEALLESIGSKRGYRIQRVYSDSEWAKDFENEFLIDRARFTFIAMEATWPHPRSDQSISLTILTYRDSSIAEYEARRLLPLPVSEFEQSPEGVVSLPLPSRTISNVVVRDSVIFLIRDHSGKQGELVKIIAGELEKLQAY